MGLFDRFKKKESATNDAPETAAKYEGDLSKTDVLYQLVRTPVEQRDESWQVQFLKALPQASFSCGNPQLITGPDGFPYFALHLPEPNVAFECFVIENMIGDFLLAQGIGVAINPKDDGADWVLTYGNIVNYSLHQEFYTAESSFSSKRTNEVVEEEEEVLIGAPNETILPQATRAILKEYLKMQGLEKPKTLLMMRRDKNTNDVSQELVFNMTPSAFPSEDHYEAVMRSLGWFLPDHYVYVGMDEAVFGNDMQEL